VLLAVVGLVVLLTDRTEDWPWWIGLALMSPLGVLFLLDDVVSEAVSGEWGDSGVGGDSGSGFGDFGGGGGGDGGG
jgi:hypothetical protein